MTRNNSKSPASKGNSKNVPKKIASGSPERKAAGVRSINRGESLDIPLEEPAAIAASFPPPGEEQLAGIHRPIAKPADSSHQKNDSVLFSQETNPSTPQAPEHRQLEEQQLKTAEVTFVEKAAAVSIPDSRRQRSRLAKSSGRTSEALSRDEQAFFMWEESQYGLLFRSSELGADPIARAGLTLASV